MRKELVIFDLDGTLVDTIADITESTNYALAKFGYPLHTCAACQSFVGNGINMLFEQALPKSERTEENIKRVKSIFMEHYDQHLVVHSKPYDGIPELLQQLHNEGYKLAVASNKYIEATNNIVHLLFPNITFYPILGQREGVPRKPNPRIVEDILSATNTKSDATLYVGDSVVDIQTAHAAHVDCCAVLWGFRARAELEDFHPQHLAATPTDIYTHLQTYKP